MIIELQNFGPIKSFKFDTSKDMHAIFGKNNIGKSYAISAVYLILKGLREHEYESKKTWDDIQTLTDITIKKISEEKLDGLIITEKIRQIIKISLSNSLLKNIENSFKNTFDIKNIENVKSLENLKILIELNTKSGFSIIYDTNSQSFFIDEFYDNTSYKLQTSDTEMGYKIENNEYVIYRNPTANLDVTLNRILSHYHHKLHHISNENSTFYLPASRSGLYNSLNSFGAIFAEISRYRLATNAKFEIPNLSEPISDYFLNLNNIENTVISDEYSLNFEQIEKEILKGTIGFDKISRKYHYIPNENPDMVFDLSFTSSMISEIAPIIAHLKYIIPLESDKPSILFIEEPEAHLHPEIQILLIEYFVKLSKGNVKIVMTSHSNYIFNKLSNLLIANKIDKDKLSVSLMKMTPEGSVIEEGAMQMDEYGIEDNNFVDVAEQLYEERMSLLEKL